MKIGIIGITSVLMRKHTFLFVQKCKLNMTFYFIQEVEKMSRKSKICINFDRATTDLTQLDSCDMVAIHASTS